MKILIYATAAEMGGAITILNHFYEEAKTNSNQYVFLLSSPLLESTDNIKIIVLRNLKKNWIIRTFTYFLKIPYLIYKLKPKEIISLNNVRILFVRQIQTLYFHQAIIFSNEKFNIFTEPYLWFYKNIYGLLFRYHLKKSNKIIVQSLWMKKKLINNLRISKEKIFTMYPKIIDFNIKYKKSNYISKLRFFYPSGFMSYKNHSVIIDALKLMDVTKTNKLSIKFTFGKGVSKKQDTFIDKIKSINLPIEFTGKKRLNEIYKMYENHLLIFPSKIESYGLPLLEAKKAGTPIICLKNKLNEEILKDYKEVFYFSNAEELKQIIYNFIQKGI